MNILGDNMPTSAKEQILNLATKHGILAEKTPIDHLGDAITRLADDHVESDETDMLLVHLFHQGHVSSETFSELMYAWQLEKRETA